MKYFILIGLVTSFSLTSYAKCVDNLQDFKNDTRFKAIHEFVDSQHYISENKKQRSYLQWRALKGGHFYLKVANQSHHSIRKIKGTFRICKKSGERFIVQLMFPGSKKVRKHFILRPGQDQAGQTLFTLAGNGPMATYHPIEKERRALVAASFGVKMPRKWPLSTSTLQEAHLTQHHTNTEKRSGLY